MIKELHLRLIPRVMEADKEMLDKLRAAGFRPYHGPDNTGYLMSTPSTSVSLIPGAFETGGGYYWSTGGSEMIIDGQIKVKQGTITSFDPKSSITFSDGSHEQYDLVIFATGYTGIPDAVRGVFGHEYGKLLQPMWGMDEEGEIRGVARDSGLPGVFLIMGNLAWSRMFSKVIALQIVLQRLGRSEECCKSTQALPLMADTWAKQKADGKLVDESVFVPYKRIAKEGHPTPVRDYE